MKCQIKAGDDGFEALGHRPHRGDKILPTHLYCWRGAHCDTGGDCRAKMADEVSGQIKCFCQGIVFGLSAPSASATVNRSDRTVLSESLRPLTRPEINRSQ